MATGRGLSAAGGGVGAAGHKCASGSHAEGRRCAQSMVKYCLDIQGNPVGHPRHPMPPASDAQKARIKPALEALLEFDN